MNDATYLSPCPFCGHMNQRFQGITDDPPLWWILCASCGALGPTRNDSEAAGCAWNIRRYPLIEPL